MPERIFHPMGQKLFSLPHAIISPCQLAVIQILKNIRRERKYMFVTLLVKTVSDSPLMNIMMLNVPLVRMVRSFYSPGK
jgi:hypothetical protein